jgi:hypothetical protein
MEKLLMYITFTILIVVLFEKCKVFSSAQKQFKNVDPMIVKVVLVFGGVFLFDKVVREYVVEGFEVPNAITNLTNISTDELMNRIKGLFVTQNTNRENR